MRFCERYEYVGSDETEVGVPPAGEQLDRDDPTGREVELRLNSRQDLAAGYRQGKFDRQIDCGIRFRNVRLGWVDIQRLPVSATKSNSRCPPITDVERPSAQPRFAGV